jgi:hypothetical protein
LVQFYVSEEGEVCIAAMDTIGGVRIPGAFCGILGFRASHGSISMAGVTHVAPTLDAVGKKIIQPAKRLSNLENRENNLRKFQENDSQ